MLKFGNTFVNVGGTYLTGFKINYNPLNLPANTIRVRTSDGNAPSKDSNTSYETATLVAGTNDVYDVYKSGTSFENLLYNSTNVVKVLGANTIGITNMKFMFFNCKNLTSVPLFDTSSVTNMVDMFMYCNSLTSVPCFNTSNVTNMQAMFENCTSLTNVPLFDTSNVTNMAGMFENCSILTSVPLFDTSSVTDIEYMFYNCTGLKYVPLFDTTKVIYMAEMFYNCVNVESGALALYQQASTQTKPPAQHSWTFYKCGSNTQTGAAELAQIPSDWK